MPHEAVVMAHLPGFDLCSIGLWGSFPHHDVLNTLSISVSAPHILDCFVEVATRLRGRMRFFIRKLHRHPQTRSSQYLSLQGVNADECRCTMILHADGDFSMIYSTESRQPGIAGLFDTSLHPSRIVCLQISLLFIVELFPSRVSLCAISLVLGVMGALRNLQNSRNHADSWRCYLDLLQDLEYTLFDLPKFLTSSFEILYEALSTVLCPACLLLVERITRL